MSANATCWEDAYRKQVEAINELRKENAALRADKARLDWFINLDEEDRVKFCRGWYRRTTEEVKAAIDAARKEAQP
jgi:hypothetical protein